MKNYKKLYQLLAIFSTFVFLLHCSNQPGLWLYLYGLVLMGCIVVNLAIPNILEEKFPWKHVK